MTELLNRRIDQLLNADAAATLSQMRRGIEKESLRITPQGRLSRTRHPRELGSALTHPMITTDYSEALLELITPPSTALAEPLEQLDRIHRYVYHHIGEELLWVNSMPCIMGSDSEIPVADYGNSNTGRMKRIYRVGLGHRYGRRMQTIAGIHYNLSFPETFWKLHRDLEDDQRPLQEFISSRYFDLLRNFQRYSWLLLYLFGASPAVCASFLQGRRHDLLKRADHTLYGPHATSLRMSDMGYQNNAQSDLHISYNNLAEYVETLTRAIKTPDPVYQGIGARENGEYRQLNANVLQIENEYYSSIRPKRTTRPGERPTQALSRRGVEYIEIRALDLNPFQPLGMDLEQTRFLDLFATYCLLLDSPLLSEEDLADSKRNIFNVVYYGRWPDLNLCSWGKPISLRDWATEKMDEMKPIAELFDRTRGGDHYTRALARQHEKVQHPDNTPSARVLETMEQNGQGFFDFAMDQARQHREYFLRRPLENDEEKQLRELAEKSLEEQAEHEAREEIPFEEYLAAYFED